MPKPICPKFASLADAYSKANAGDENAQRCIIGCLSNMGDPTMRPPDGKTPKWRRSYQGLMEVLDSLVGEYGHKEESAEKGILAELNAARRYSEDIKLEDEPASPKKSKGAR